MASVIGRRRRSVQWGLALALLGSSATFGSKARAEEPAPAPSEDPATVRARDEFMRGVELVKSSRWGEALSAFEKSSAIRPHPVTTFNIGACQRAMASYTLARQTLRRSLSEQAAGRELPSNLASDARGFLEQIESTLARVRVTVETPGTMLAIDGRPIALEQSGSSEEWVAGVLPPGKGNPAPRGAFDLALNPGPHVLTLSRKGFRDVVLNRSFASGRGSPLVIRLEQLPATLRISSNVPGALVRVNDADVGPVPVDVLRPGGTYEVQVTKTGYEDYQSTVAVRPGEQMALAASLSEERIPITKRWWFWAGAGVVLVGGVVATYALTRPDPQPPPYDGGNTGWVAQPTGVRF